MTIIETQREPFLVGVIGHRDLVEVDTDAVRALVSTTLESYVSNLPNLQVVLLSALAAGADTLVAEIALDMGIDVAAILPLELSDYEKDFESEAELSRFRSILQRCKSVQVSTPKVLVEGAARTFTRDERYQYGARFLSGHSHVLLALWNGDLARIQGGTADTLHFRLDTRKSFASQWEDIEQPVGGQTIWIPVRRMSAFDRNVSVQDAQILSAQLNAQRWNGEPSEALLIADSMSGVLELHQFGGSTPSENLLYAADGEAIMLQGLYVKWVRILLLLGVLSVTAVDVMQAVERRWVTALPLFGFLLLFAIWRIFSRRQLKDRFQQMRALAEGARVQEIWTRAGITECVADSYLAGGKGSVEWVRILLQGAWIKDQSTISSNCDVELASNWMNDQVNYFNGANGRPGAIAKNALRSQKLGNLSAFAFTCAGLAFVGSLTHYAVDWNWNIWFVQIDQILWGIALAAGAALLAYKEVMAYQEMSRRYSQAVRIFEDGLHELKSISETHDSDAEVTIQDQRKAVIHSVGVEALREAGDWLALHSDRSVRPF